MSAIIESRAVDLLWKQWTALGVAGVGPSAKQAIDLEALITFTPFVAQIDPRLVDESIDWCAQFAKSFVSISRLRQMAKLIPPHPNQHRPDLPSMLINGTALSEVRGLSHKSRPPSLDLPSLLQLRSRYVFGVGARADVLAHFAMLGRRKGGLRASEIRPSGYTKAAALTVLDELAQAGVLAKLTRATSVRYELAKEAPLRSLLAPLPGTMPPWAERFSIVAAILEAWRAYGSRATYAVELAKVLDGVRHLAAAIGQRAPTAEPSRLVRLVDRWATILLEDDPWQDEWIVNGEDVASQIQDALYDDIVEVVHAGDHPVARTDLSDFAFRPVEDGVMEFAVQFSAEHPREDFSFNGYVDGTFTFDPAATKERALLKSIRFEKGEPHFDMGDER
jgi:hypothetical protein